jgi:hypothetical protein
MNLRELLYVIKEKFPDAIGCMVTGSQLTASHASSDIDLVIFDLSHSNVASHGFLFNKTAIDCTIFPVQDMENVIINESFDKRGVVLSMILSGSIVEDTEHIVKGIQNFVIDFYKKLKSESQNPNLVKSISDIQTIRRYFDRQMTDVEKFLLFCDLVTAVSTAETYRLGYWQSTFYRKAKIITSVDNSVGKKMLELARNLSYQQNHEDINSFIDTYLNIYNGASAKEGNKSFIIDLHTGKSSWHSALKKICIKLESYNNLNNHFHYAHRTDKKYGRSFNYDICLHFTSSKTSSQDEILTELVAFLKDEMGMEPHFNIINFPYCLLTDIQELRTSIRSKLYLFRQQNNFFLEEAIINTTIAIELCYQIIKVMEVDVADLVIGLEILTTRWLIPRPLYNSIIVGKEFQHYKEERHKELYQNYKQLQKEKDKFQISDTLTNLLAEFAAAISLGIKKKSKNPLPYFSENVLRINLINDCTNIRYILFLIEEIYLLWNLDEVEKLHGIIELNERIIN